VAGLPPIREVLLGDGPAVEVVVQYFLDLGQLVKPSEDFGAGESVFEAMAELIAQGGWETADFTSMGHNIYRGLERHEFH
jgi:hypothetical protein